MDPKTICTCEACISLYDPATVRLIKATYQNAALANGLLLQGENISESERMTHCRQVMEIAMNGGPPDLKKPENRHGTPHHCTYAPERRLQRYVSMETLPAAGDAEMPSSPASSPKKGGRYDGDDDDDGGVIFDDDELGPIPIVHMPRPLPGGREGHSAVLVQSPAAPVGGVVGGAGGAIAGAGNPFTPGPGEMQTKMSVSKPGGGGGGGGALTISFNCACSTALTHSFVHIILFPPPPTPLPSSFLCPLSWSCSVAVMETVSSKIVGS